MLLVLLVVTALTIVRIRSILAVVMLSGLYRFLMASIFLVLDAVDVATVPLAIFLQCQGRYLTGGELYSAAAASF